MSDDYTKEIKERLAAYQDSDARLWYEESSPEESKFLNNAPTDIANLLAEREVLRDALRSILREIACCAQYDGNSNIYLGSPNIDAIKKALAWEQETKEGNK